MKMTEREQPKCLGEKLERLYILKKFTKDDRMVYYVCTDYTFIEVAQTKKVRYGKDLEKEMKISTTFQAPKRSWFAII